MKSCFLIFAFIFLAIDAFADNAIPSELTGTWRTKTSDGPGYLALRSDGIIFIGSSVGMAGIATFDSKKSILMASLRDEHVEKAKAVLIYNRSDSTICLTKLVCYYDMHGSAGRLSKPQEEKPKITFTRYKKTLPEFVHSIDIRDLSKQP